MHYSTISSYQSAVTFDTVKWFWRPSPPF